MGPVNAPSSDARRGFCDGPEDGGTQAREARAKGGRPGRHLDSTAIVNSPTFTRSIRLPNGPSYDGTAALNSSAGGGSPSKTKSGAGGSKFTFSIAPIHYKGNWQFDYQSKHITFNPTLLAGGGQPNKSVGQGVNPTSVRSITLQDVEYVPRDADHGLFEYRGNRIIKLPDGFRWENRDGSWEFYNEAGRLIQTGRRNLVHMNLIYDGDGRLAALDDALGHRLITYTYSGDQVASIEDATGRRMEYTWENGHLAAVRDPAGEITHYEYDSSGRIARRVGPNGQTANIRYDNGGYVYSVLDDEGNGKYFTYHYDTGARTYYAKITTTGGQVKELVFDSQGQLLFRRLNGVIERSVVRDQRSEVSTDDAGHETRRDYDEYGNVIRETQPDGGTTSYEYDLRFNKPTRIIDPRGAITLMAYDASGNLTNKIEAAGTPIARTNRWVNNDLDQVIRHIDGRGNKWIPLTTMRAT